MAYYTLELVLALKENQNPLSNSIFIAMNDFSRHVQNWSAKLTSISYTTFLISTIYLQKFDVIVPYQTFQQCKILREWGMSKIKRHFNVKIRYVNMYTQ